MRLFLMRHGIAGNREKWTGDDAARPLTSEGLKKTRQAARGLQICQPTLDLVASSPLLRAEQTARAVREIYVVADAAAPPLAIWPELGSAEVERLLPRLRALQGVETVVLVGHEPGLGRLAAHLLSGSPDSLTLDFKKAAVCALDLDADFLRATLRWHMGPRQLRLIGKAHH